MSAASAHIHARECFIESNGLVTIEAESTISALGSWEKKTAITNYTGSGYLEFTANNPESGPANSPLAYQFKITKPGLYYLHLYCAREDVTIKDKLRNDVANDCYVRVEGDFTTGPKPGNRHGDNATIGLLKSDIKFFGGDMGRFAWAFGNRLDPGGKTNKRVAAYQFKADQTYTLVISGRSKLFKFDRIVFRHDGVTPEVGNDTTRVESKRIDSTDREAPIEIRNGTISPGRLAIITDGNAVDPDDVCATPVSLAMIRALGLEKRLIHFNHSCELVNNPEYKKPNGEEEEIARRKMNQESCDGTASRFGGFEHLTFWNCRTQKEAAVADLRTAINASTAANPLWIIEAGEPDVIYEAALSANPGVMQHVNIITHHPNNDKGGYHDLDDVLALQPPGANLFRITDQNKNLNTPLTDWHWARDHSDPRIQWLWERGEFAANRAFVDPSFKYRAIAEKFDCSDAGMALYWLTGADNGGIQEGSPEDIRKILNKLAD